jgi:hypothetical protein
MTAVQAMPAAATYGEAHSVLLKKRVAPAAQRMPERPIVNKLTTY